MEDYVVLQVTSPKPWEDDELDMMAERMAKQLQDEEGGGWEPGSHALSVFDNNLVLSVIARRPAILRRGASASAPTRLITLDRRRMQDPLLR